MTDILGEGAAKEVWSLFHRARAARSEWDEQAQRAYRYVGGKQYEGNEEAILESRNMPALTMNRLFELIRNKKAFALKNLYNIKILPRTIGDVSIARDLDEVVKYVQYRNNFPLVQDQVNQDALCSGIGWCECIYDPMADDSSVDIQINELDPFEIYTDPDCQRADLDDAEYIIKVRWMSREKLERLFPKAKDKLAFGTWKAGAEEAPGSISSYVDAPGFREARRWPAEYGEVERENGALLLECWKREYGPGAIFFNPETQRYVFEDTDEDGNPENLSSGDLKQLIHVKNRRSRIRIMHVVGNVVLQDKLSPYIHNKFPFVPLYCYTNREEGRRTYFGEAKNVLEPQSVYNKMLSLALQNFSLVNNSIWLVRKGTTDVKKVEEAGSTPGVVIESTGSGPLTDNIVRLQGVPAFADAMRVLQFVEYQMDRIVGIFQAQRGEQPLGAKSGKHIEALIEQGKVASEGIGLYSQIFRTLLGQLIISNIQQFYSNRDIVRVVTDAGVPQDIDLKRIKDLATMKFDVVVSSGEGILTNMLEQSGLALELATRFPGMILPDEIMEYMPLPNRDRIIQRLKMQAQAGIPTMGQTGQGPEFPGGAGQ